MGYQQEFLRGITETEKLSTLLSHTKPTHSFTVGKLLLFLFYPITLEGHGGTTDEFATTPFHLDLFSAALVELAKSIHVHSLVLSSSLFICLPLFLIVHSKSTFPSFSSYLSFPLVIATYESRHAQKGRGDL